MRGDIWTVAGGIYASNPRPVVIIQDDVFTTDSVTVLPFTTLGLDAPLLRLPIPATSANGLAQDSWIQIEKLTTVRRSNLGHHLGRLTTPELRDVERLLLVFLGLAR